MIFNSIVFGQKKDTIFLKREIFTKPYPHYHAVYIDTSRNTRSLLASFKVYEIEKQLYEERLQELNGKFKKIKLQNGFPKKWVVLRKYKGKYYLYSPSDFGNHFKFQITDSSTIDYTMEGPEPSAIESITYLSPNKVIIKRINSWNENYVNIDYINRKSGIAKISFSSDLNSKRLRPVLVVAFDKIHLYPTIVNYSPQGKFVEFEFDEIDFDNL